MNRYGQGLLIKMYNGVETESRRKKMDEAEFRRLLDLFPVVRSRDYQLNAWQDTSDEGYQKQMMNQGIDLHHAFWEKLKLAAGRKVGSTEAERFCKAFQHIHQKLVYEGLSLDSTRTYINSSEDIDE